MAEMAEGIRVEFGAWVEGTVAKKIGGGMRKVWTSPAPAGESERLGVFRDGKFVFALHTGTDADLSAACDMLAGAMAALTERLERDTAPKPAPKAPARKAPTPPPAPVAPAKPAPAVKAPIASLPKPAPLTGRVSNPAPKVADAGQDLLDWLDAVRV